MNRAILLLAALSVLSVVGVPAATQTKKSASEKAAYNQELEKLKREKPTEYEEARIVFTFAAELLLAKLGYSVGPLDGVLDEKTQVALRLYQKNRKIPVTGDPISFETVEQIRADDAAVEYRPISLPMRNIFTDLWDSGYVSAEGTWTIADEDMAWPEQTSKIECHRQLGTCVEAIATVTGEGSNRHLSVEINTYKIERWDQLELVTKPIEFGCTRYVRRINRVQKSVSGIRSTTSTDDACKAVDKSEKYLVLANGFEVWQKLSKQQRENWRHLMQISPDILKKLENRPKE